MNKQKQKQRHAYLTLIDAVRDKPIDKAKNQRAQVTQADDSAHYIRTLQDIGVYLGIVL